MTTTPAQDYRAALAHENAETVAQLAGIARMHGYTFHATTRHFVCYCGDGEHAGNLVLERAAAYDADHARAMTATGGHPITDVTVQMTSPAVEL